MCCRPSALEAIRQIPSLGSYIAYQFCSQINIKPLHLTNQQYVLQTIYLTNTPPWRTPVAQLKINRVCFLHLTHMSYVCYQNAIILTISSGALCFLLNNSKINNSKINNSKINNSKINNSKINNTKKLKTNSNVMLFKCILELKIAMCCLRNYYFCTFILLNFGTLTCILSLSYYVYVH